jgi:hypothetical protein
LVGNETTWLGLAVTAGLDFGMIITPVRFSNRQIWEAGLNCPEQKAGLIPYNVGIVFGPIDPP